MPLPNTAVRTAIDEPKVDRQARIDRLEKQLERVKGQVAEQERLERRWALFQGACAKLRQELGKTLTAEEYQAIDGLYIFLHSGDVDFVRHIPSGTSRGEDKRLEKDLDTVDALRELEELTGERGA